MAVSSDGSYGIDEGVMFGSCCLRRQRLESGFWFVHNAFAKEKIAATLRRFLKEKNVVDGLFASWGRGGNGL